MKKLFLPLLALFFIRCEQQASERIFFIQDKNDVHIAARVVAFKNSQVFMTFEAEPSEAIMEKGSIEYGYSEDLPNGNYNIVTKPEHGTAFNTNVIVNGSTRTIYLKER